MMFATLPKARRDGRAAVPQAEQANVRLAASGPERAGRRPPGLRLSFRCEAACALVPGLARFLVYGTLAWFALILLETGTYRFVNPSVSSLMLLRWAGGARIRQEWVPVSRLPPHLVRAVVVAEDGRFCQHPGIDFAELGAAFARARDGVPRGASTISMQVAKNLFLWPGKSYLRKIVEVPVTLALELILPKRRIFEIYANIAEWGPGIFGAEAAARHHFGKRVQDLTPRESALLAAALPNPFVRRAGRPGPGTLGIAARIQQRMRAAAGITACISGGGTSSRRPRGS